jgi:integrase
VGEARPAKLREYLALRRSKAHEGAKHATLDLERQFIRRALAVAFNDERILVNPLAGYEFDTQYAPETVSHCREFRCKDGDDLHKLASFFFGYKEWTQVLGWQALIESYTGLRGDETRKLRWDAKPGEPGFMDDDQLHVKRDKKGINPYVELHPALSQAIKALKRWHSERFPQNPHWLPHYDKALLEPLPLKSLSKALRQHSIKAVGYKIRAHGNRAFYVTALRSEGVNDGAIAFKIGDKTGAALIAQVYGDLPPNWRSTKAGKISWLPVTGDLAWNVFKPCTAPCTVEKQHTAPVCTAP